MSYDKLWQTSIAEFLNQAASSAPTPGGGSVSAYAGALAAAMVCMVGNLTVGKEKYKDVEPQVQEILEQAQAVLNDLKNGLNEDIRAFSSFMDVLKLPKVTDEEKKVRHAKMQEALILATDTPLHIAENCLKVLKLAHSLASIGSKSAISDIGVAAYLAENSLKAAILTVGINLPKIESRQYCEVVKERQQKLVAEAEGLRAEIIKVVQSQFV